MTDYLTKEDLANLKFELIKWQIGVGVTASLMLVGAMAMLLKLYKNLP